MDNFNLQGFVKKSKNEFYTNLYEGKEKHSMEEEMHDDHKMEENHQSLDPEVADRIEGLLNISMKTKFINTGVNLINDFLQDEAMDVEDVISHLANELTKEYHTAGDHSSAVALEEEEEVEDVETETPETSMDVDVDMDMPTPSEEPDNKEVFSQLVDAYEAAKELGDEKLTRQLANTITYFNKTIIFGDEE